jgi:hexosaminidase
VAPTSGSAQEARQTPVTVPALTNWSAEQGGYDYGKGARLVAGTPAERRVADTLADDLKAAGQGIVPVVRGGARSGDIVIEVRACPAVAAARDGLPRCRTDRGVRAAPVTGLTQGRGGHEC